MTNYDIKTILDSIINNIKPEIFVKNDPVQIPHLFTKKEDIEIIAFLTSILAWGNRKQIIKNAYNLLKILHNSPYNYIIQITNKHKKEFNNFKHRTITGTDMFNFCITLKYIYTEHGGLENIFLTPYLQYRNLKYSLQNCYNLFSSFIPDNHSLRHISNINKNSAAKRLNLFLRWMVRKDFKKIDIGIWNNISPSDLYIPLDVHVAFAARKLNLLNRKSNDWIAVLELTNKLRQIDLTDPIKYDLALFEYSIKTKT
jgi:uncharacterized protein (TIGR02757 family)